MGESLRFSYDRESDILYIHLRDGPSESVEELDDGIIVERDEKGGVMGIEVWNAKKRGILKQLAEITAGTV